jgi:hypothetical protein
MKHLLTTVAFLTIMNASADLRDFATDFLRYSYEEMSDQRVSADELPVVVDLKAIGTEDSSLVEPVVITKKTEISGQDAEAAEAEPAVLQQKNKTIYDMIVFAAASALTVKTSMTLLDMIKQHRINNKEILKLLACWVAACAGWEYFEANKHTLL